MLSVSKMRGCFSAAGIPAMFLVAIALVVGLLGRCGPTGPNSTDAQQLQLGDVLFTVNDYPYYEGELKYLRALSAQQGQPSNNPFAELNRLTDTVKSAVSDCTVLAMCKWQNVKVDDTEVVDTFSKQINDRIDSELKQAKDMRALMISSSESALENLKKTKPADSKEVKEAQANLDRTKGMTDEQFFAQLNRVELSTIRAQAEEQIEKLKSDPMYRRLVQTRIFEQRLVEKYANEVQVSEDMIKESYDRITYKEISVSNALHPDSASRAAEALAKVKAGMDFDQAIMTYSDLKPTDPKKKEQFSNTLDRMTVLSNPETEPLAKLKVNRVSEVIKSEAGYKIYLVTKIEIATPANFAKVKDARLKEIQQSLGGSTYFRERQKFDAARKIEWKNDEPKLMYEYIQMTTGDRHHELDGPQNYQKRVDAWKDLYARCTEAADSMDTTSSALLRYGVFKMYEENLKPGPEKDKLESEKLALFREIEAEIPYYVFRKEYLDLLIASKAGDDALKELLSLAENLSDTTPEEKQRVADIEKLLPVAEASAKKDSPLVGQIQAELKRWHEEEKSAKEIEDEQKRQDAKDAEDLRKEKAALKAEQDKKQGASKTNPPPQPGDSGSQKKGG